MAISVIFFNYRDFVHFIYFKQLLSQSFKKTKTTSPHDMNKLNGIENVGKFDFKSAKSMKNSN